MTFSRCTLILLALLCGCAGKTYKVDNPVVGPAPPRKVKADAYAQVEEAPSSDIQQAGYNRSEETPLVMTDVVARINGKPILAGDILEQYAGRLKEAEKQLPPRKYREIQEMLIERDLGRYVETTLMAESIRSKLKEEQITAIDGQLDKFFEMQVQEMMKQAEAPTLMDLEAKLQEQGMSLATMRKLFGDRQLASEYVKQRLGDAPPFTPEELKAQYAKQMDQYTTPAQVKWQQLQVSTNRPGGEQAAFKVIQQAFAEMNNGADFDAVVKKYSDGPLAKNGGHWDWMQPQSVANERVRAAIGDLQVGELSDVIKGSNSLQIVRVTGRRNASATPFEDVQEDIRKQLTDAWREARAKEIIDELKSQSVIETLFDTQENADSTAAKPAFSTIPPAGLAG
ncbi:MAG: peptidyl-prolyl cis-trans isomerase [Planctomycetaceae bacterium]